MQICRLSLSDNDLWLDDLSISWAIKHQANIKTLVSVFISASHSAPTSGGNHFVCHQNWKISTRKFIKKFPLFISSFRLISCDVFLFPFVRFASFSVGSLALKKRKSCEGKKQIDVKENLCNLRAREIVNKDQFAAAFLPSIANYCKHLFCASIFVGDRHKLICTERPRSASASPSEF